MDSKSVLFAVGTEFSYEIQMNVKLQKVKLLTKYT